jgi:hypothetical protein
MLGFVVFGHRDASRRFASLVLKGVPRLVYALFGWASRRSASVCPSRVVCHPQGRLRLIRILMSTSQRQAMIRTQLALTTIPSLART